MEIKSKWGLTPIKSGTFWIPVIIIALSIWVFIHNQSLCAIAGILFLIPVYDVINGYLGSPRIVIANEGITLLSLYAGNRRLAWTEIVSWDIENDKTEPHIPAVRINIKEGSILLRMQFYRNPEQLTQGIDLGYKTRHSKRKADMQNFNPYHIEPIKGKEQENIGKEQFEIVSRKLRNIPWNGDAGVFIGTG